MGEHLQTCPACGGDGGGETLPTGPHDTGRWIECDHCDGTGSVETEPAGIEHTEQPTDTGEANHDNRV